MEKKGDHILPLTCRSLGLINQRRCCDSQTVSSLLLSPVIINKCSKYTRTAGAEDHLIIIMAGKKFHFLERHKRLRVIFVHLFSLTAHSQNTGVQVFLQYFDIFICKGFQPVSCLCSILLFYCECFSWNSKEMNCSQSTRPWLKVEINGQGPLAAANDLSGK